MLEEVVVVVVALFCFGFPLLGATVFFFVVSFVFISVDATLGLRFRTILFEGEDEDDKEAATTESSELEELKSLQQEFMLLVIEFWFFR